MHRYLFLDIDGVLNSSTHAIQHGGYDHLIPQACNFICKLYNKHNVRIVISSTWRKHRSLIKIQSIINNYARQYATFSDRAEVYGATPILPWDPKLNRGMEINSYIATNMDMRDNYCIIDDDRDMLPHQIERCVFTDPSIGMTEENYIDILNILELKEIK